MTRRFEGGRGLVGEDREEPKVVLVEPARPSFERVMTPTSVSSWIIGTTSIDSSTSSVPGMVAPRGSMFASSMSSGTPCFATQPVNPSPTRVRRSSRSTRS